jgi:hypothetical protein
MAPDTDTLVIPFGVDRWSREDIAVSRDSSGRLRVASPFSAAVIDKTRDEPLRLNNSRYALAFKPAEEAEPDLVATLRDCIKLECDPWNRQALAFLDGYFGALERLVAADEAAIAGQAVGFGKLFDRRDWIFSALRPLPRAHLAIADRHIRVTFAFWNGAALTAVDLDAGDLMPGMRRERESLLRDAGVDQIATLPSGETAWAGLLAKLSPPGGLWRGEALPLGPFASTALDTFFDS